MQNRSDETILQLLLPRSDAAHISMECKILSCQAENE